MNIKKIAATILFFTITLVGTFAQNSKSQQLTSTLSELRINTTYTNAFNLYNMDKYSKNSIGGQIGFEYTLLPEIGKNFDMGFYGRAAFQDFIPYNLQLISLYSYSFSSGIFAQWNLKNDFALLIATGAGFLISDINFVSAEKGNINDIYYDFMIETDINLRKTILHTNKINLLSSIGCHVAFYNEKSENFMNIGPTFGLLIDFKPYGQPSTGAKNVPSKKSIK